MEDLPSTTPATTTPATKAPRDNALQSKAHANAIASSERSIQSVLGSPELLLALAPSGFNETEVNKGLSLFRTAQEKFDARQEAMALVTETLTARNKVCEAAKNEYVAYRTTVQVNYRKADRANLGADGRVPADGDKFRTNARSAYSTALSAPYLDVLSQYGFNEERLNAALASLDQLAAAESTHQNAQSKAQTATEARDVATEALKSWMMKLRSIAKTTLKARPDLLTLLKA
jgi:uncharacterized protein Smg (DUF494 family)